MRSSCALVRYAIERKNGREERLDLSPSGHRPILEREQTEVFMTKKIKRYEEEGKKLGEIYVIRMNPR